jgi:hypothetical protein
LASKGKKVNPLIDAILEEDSYKSSDEEEEKKSQTK